MTPNFNFPPNFNFTALTETTVATITKTNAAALTGFEQLARYFLDFAGRSVEETVAAGKTLASVKSPIEFFQVQSKLAQESFQTFASEGKKVSELATAVAKDVSAPVAEHFKTTLVSDAKVTPLKKAA